jgi:hypothetical protein
MKKRLKAQIHKPWVSLLLCLVCTLPANAQSGAPGNPRFGVDINSNLGVGFGVSTEGVEGVNFTSPRLYELMKLQHSTRYFRTWSPRVNVSVRNGALAVDAGAEWSAMGLGGFYITGVIEPPSSRGNLRLGAFADVFVIGLDGSLELPTGVLLRASMNEVDREVGLLYDFVGSVNSGSFSAIRALVGIP